jgi:hypothetical protein
MKHFALVSMLLSGVVLLGCTNDKLPTDFTGGYVSTTQDTVMESQHTGSPFGTTTMRTGFSKVSQLTVTSGGISTRGGMPSMHVGPLSMGEDTSDLFTSVSCEGKACSFRTKGGCEGTMEKTSAGNLTVVARGECSVWSGTWTPSHS